MRKKLLFLTNHRLHRAPNQRFRFEQYLTYLQSHGFDIEISYLLNEHDDKIFYAKGKILAKIWILIKSFLKRCRDLRKIRKHEFDAVFISREAFFLGPPLFEKRIARLGVPYIYDFDDAIWLENISDGNRLFKRLKYFSKIPEIIRKATIVTAGNNYLADYAKQFNPNTIVIPTTIDTTYHVPVAQVKEKNSVIIGWTGSTTTLPYLNEIASVLCTLKDKLQEKLGIVIIGAVDFRLSGCEVDSIPWRRETEITDLQQLDIGVMPLPDNEWTRGKCGLKLLQYMAIGLPVVASPVGVNVEIVDHGINGFLASTMEEWEKYLSMLIEDKELRQRMGRAGRKKVEQFYAAEVWKETYLKVFLACVNNEQLVR